MSIRNNYNHTLRASYLGYITQAIVNNFAPLLFLTFQSTWGVPLDRIALLITVNFGIQLTTDLLSSKFVDRIGYRPCIVAAHVFAAAGLAGLAVFPFVLPPYLGLLVSISLYSVGGGLIEVLISPIVESCPTERKAAAMSLLHSFYCWGQVGVAALSTAFFVLAGVENWRVLAVIWAALPAVNAVYFANVPIAALTEEGAGMSVRELLGTRLFWVLALLMVCSGASELAMSQWASAFAEAGLGVSKTIGDLAGPCFFAVLMGSARVLHAKYSERMDLVKWMRLSALLCLGSYLLAAFSPVPVLGLLGCGLCGLSVGLLWPGTFSIAAESCPRGGTAMFALLALAGDLGCAGGPTIVGIVSGMFDDRLQTGLMAAAVFPVLLMLGLSRCKRLSPPQR